MNIQLCCFRFAAWEIHLHKLNFARISSGGKSCFCFSTVLLVQLNEKDTFGKDNLETTGE